MTTATYATAAQDFFKAATESTNAFFKAFPKNPVDAKEAFEKVQAVFRIEFEKTQEMWKTYGKAMTGDATANEIAKANAKAADLLKATAFGSMLAIPGTIFILPLIVEKAKEYNVDIVPASVATQFKI